MSKTSAKPASSSSAAPVDHGAVLRGHLEAARAARAAANAHPATAAQRTALRRWQADRLAKTHADLLTSPRYVAAATFFLTDLYSAADTSERDAELDRALGKMVKLMPAAALEALAMALEADALAEQLDAAVCERLFGDRSTDTITERGYAAAYRAATSRDDRTRQIVLVDAVGRQLERTAHAPMLVNAVRLMRAPARAAGFGELQAFLERGLTAFRSMQGAAAFLDIVLERETAVMDALFAGRPLPQFAA